MSAMIVIGERFPASTTRTQTWCVVYCTAATESTGMRVYRAQDVLGGGFRTAEAAIEAARVYWDAIAQRREPFGTLAAQDGDAPTGRGV